MKIISLLCSCLVLCSCWSKNAPSDQHFMDLIKKNSSIQSNLKTEIKLSPKKVIFTNIKPDSIIQGSLWVKNIGNKNFNVDLIKENCECLKLNYKKSSQIIPNDSLKLDYELNTKGYDKFISQSIVIIGNCPFGNETFIIQAFIN